MTDQQFDRTNGAPGYSPTTPGSGLATRRAGRPKGSVTIADRYARLAFAAACRSHEADVIKFWYDTMMDHEADMAHRIVCSKELMNRAHGLPIQITNETTQETRKQILEVRWMAPDPNDHSKLIEPEPD